MVLKSNSLYNKTSLNGSSLYIMCYIVGVGYVRGQIQQDTLDNKLCLKEAPIIYIYIEL